MTCGRSRRRFGFLLFAIVAGCTKGDSVPEIAAHVPPLSELSGVALGMRAWTLTSHRPHAVAAPYQGFRETVGAYTVTYEVPGSEQDGQAPPGWERLVSVTATQRLPSADSALTRWRVEAKRMSDATHVMPQCYTAVSANRSDWGAVWPHDRAQLFILAHAERASSNGDSARSWIDIGVEANSTHRRAIFRLTEPRPCDA